MFVSSAFFNDTDDDDAHNVFFISTTYSAENDVTSTTSSWRSVLDDDDAHNGAVCILSHVVALYGRVAMPCYWSLSRDRLMDRWDRYQKTIERI